ncbi:MAG: hypothetical protein RLZZ430_735 [Cyanobacteriota bacterium]|jgi:hypothetical protein
MCLTPEGRESYSLKARDTDDSKLHELNLYYRQKVCTTVDWELHNIVRNEINYRHESKMNQEIDNRDISKVVQLERSLWLSSKRGRLVETIKRWLVR